MSSSTQNRTCVETGLACRAYGWNLLDPGLCQLQGILQTQNLAFQCLLCACSEGLLILTLFRGSYPPSHNLRYSGGGSVILKGTAMGGGEN